MEKGGSLALPGLEAIKLQIEECDAAAWIDASVARDCLLHKLHDVQFHGIAIDENKDASKSAFSTSQLLGMAEGGSTAAVESLALGTAFVIKIWLKNA